MARLFRFWMTGCIAVVAAAMASARPVSANERHVTARSSRYDVAETIERIEARAKVHGLSLFARLKPPAGGTRVATAGNGEGAMMVFESARGGTPVLMAADRSAPSLPLSLIVRRNEAGATEVVLVADEWEGLPDEVASDVTHLPRVVEEALG